MVLKWLQKQKSGEETFMRKKMAIFLCLCLLLGLSGCEKTECEFCGEMKRCKQYDNAFFGVMEVCDDCMDEMRTMFDWFILNRKDDSNDKESIKISLFTGNDVFCMWLWKNNN